ncbi:uncharacterized protein LOC131261825 [Anopheles coustani]|uniref:uncharacterized protein LOC131261825 n=2 Tax=coustani group TaxID=59130 RepID=UPI00265A43E3|nr:uncharacterized protein LOC131261825 [Anopheles coustani]
MVSLQSFMLRMHLLPRSSPCNPATRRRRFSSSASNGIYNNNNDVNNNFYLSPIVNPSLKRHKVSAFVYSTEPTVAAESITSSQLAVHVFEGLDVKLRYEQSISVSVEKFLSYRQFVCAQMRCEEPSVISEMYIVPRTVPVSCVTTAYPSYDATTGQEQMMFRTTVEFRRKYFTAAQQTINEEQQEVDREPPRYVSHACWIVSEFQN